MANKTNSLSFSYATFEDCINAKIFLKKEYPEIEYDSTTDSFLYRGYSFDYFKSGISINGGLDSYLLVDKEDSRLWLFSYGNREDRWKEYLDNKQKQFQDQDQRKSWFCRILNFFRLLIF